MSRYTPKGLQGRVRAGRWSASARWLACAAALGTALLAGAGCRHLGEYVWVDAYKDTRPAAKSGYTISRGDLISVRVWNQENMSGRARVRSDGMISLPFVNDVKAAGLEPESLASRLQTKLKEFIVNPVVTVSLEEAAPIDVSFVGEVTRPGVYRLDQDAGVLKGLATAGGLTTLAGRDRIFVLRRPEGAGDAPPVRIRFRYEALAHAEGPAARFRLRSGDVVVVE
jgi:polysaccharide export outer membrane protein